MSQRERPKFTGINTYRDPLGRYSVRYPSDWNTFEIREGVPARRGKPRKARLASSKRLATEENPLPVREGIGFSPDPRDGHTALTMWVSPLDEAVVAEDFAELKEGVDAGLEALEECRVEHASDDILSNLLKFERIYTFREGGETRKRKQWLLYVDTWLMCLTWQGSTPDAYAYWYAMANHSFLTIELPQALWFATDRDLAAARTGDAVKTSDADAGEPLST
jgi:hypothetical protein